MDRTQARLVLNQRFIATFILHASCAHMTPQRTFFNDVFTTYLRPSCVSQFYSSTNVFNDVFTTYLSKRQMSCTAIEDKP